jgi:hypothetical protein
MDEHFDGTVLLVRNTDRLLVFRHGAVRGLWPGQGQRGNLVERLQRRALKRGRSSFSNELRPLSSSRVLANALRDFGRAKRDVGLERSLQQEAPLLSKEKQGTQFVFGTLSDLSEPERGKTSRVALGGYPPRAPTDPYMRD